MSKTIALRRLYSSLAISVCCLMLATMLGRSLAERHSKSEQDTVYVPSPAFLRAVSFGYLEALGDLYWIQTIVFSGQRAGSRLLEDVERLILAVGALSPRLRRAYVWGGAVPVVVAGNQYNRKAIDVSIRIYKTGLRHFPESHELLTPLSILLLNDVQRSPEYSADEKTAARAQGASLLRQSAAFGGDALVRRYAATIIDEHVSHDVTVSWLRSQLMTAEDEDLRNYIEEKLALLGDLASLSDSKALQAELAERRKQDLPYVPVPLYAILSKRVDYQAEGAR